MSTTTAPTDAITYDDLYARWEKGNWRATEIDFAEDRVHWHERFSDLERRAAVWNYALFLHGEDAVAYNLSPYIDAAPREEQKYFLATQQVDEARHAVFFARFMKEVVEAGDTIASSLEATRPELTWGFRKVFGRLDTMADELRADRSKPKLAAAITLYHLVIEGDLAQPGQHFIESYLTDRDILPGFRTGMRNVSLDEQRHIGFGVKMLSDLVREDPDCVEAVAELLREVIPWATAVFVPPNWDERYATCFGFTLEDIFEEGATSMETKLRAAGLPIDEMRLPIPMDLSPRDRGRRGLALLRANYIGEKVGAPSHDPEVVAMLFDGMRRSLDHRHAPERPAVIQWDFTDAEPWHLRIDNGSSSVGAGRVEAPDLSLACRLEDWVDITARREDPRRALALRKLRPKGSLRLLWRTQKLFG